MRMLRLFRGHAARGRAVYGAQPCARRTAATSSHLQQLQESIGLGLRSRLMGLAETGEQASEQAHVAVVGRHSAEFAAALRAVRAAGAAVAPVDLQACQSEELTEQFAEMNVDLAITLGTGTPAEGAVKESARRLGAACTSVASLCQEGASSSAAVDIAQSREAPPLFLFSSCPSSTTVRAACVSDDALSSRISGAVALWGLTSDDTVLSLGLRADTSAAVVDALEAPMAVGAAVAMPEHRSSRGLQVWDLWAALRDEQAATVVFVAADWCQHLVDSHSQLSAPLRDEFSRRWASQSFRHTVAVVAGGEVPSVELTQRWAAIFGCPLTLHFSCPEAGSLYVVDPTASAPMHSTFGSQGTEWSLSEPEGELLVRRGGVFQCYHNRPRSTSEAFTDDGFCRTGHRAVLDDFTGGLRPQPPAWDSEFQAEVDRHLHEGPPWETFGMAYNWHVKKVLMRKYWYWKPKKGYPIITKKDLANVKWLVYKPRYKRAKPMK